MRKTGPHRTLTWPRPGDSTLLVSSAEADQGEPSGNGNLATALAAASPTDRPPHLDPVVDLTGQVVPGLVPFGERRRRPRPTSSLPRPSKYRVSLPWERTYVRTVIALDATAVGIAALVALFLRFADAGVHPRQRDYVIITVLLPLAWAAVLGLSRAYEIRFLGLGSEEFKRVSNAAIRLTALVATASYATHASIARGYVLVALPMATVLTMLGRYGARKVLSRLRQNGRCVHRLVVVGHQQAVVDLVRTVRRESYAGIEVIGACLDRPDNGSLLAQESVPVLGGLDSVVSVITEQGATAVAVTSCDEMSGPALRRMSWELEGTGVDILLAPALTDIAGPRIHIRPVAGLPLLHVDEPELSGARRLIKGVFDRAAALAALVVLLPVLIAIALAVRLTSSGPALFRQTRCGRSGEPFTIYKFRSMRVDAEAGLEVLLAQNERNEGLLFKIRKDPRITAVGKFLRRYSLDELPQLLNVVRGDMSLIGPRPPLPSEVARYETDVRRRLLVKPGLTGLWQVSGRSDLTWEESVRLDLQYVENWCLTLDFMILWKTAFAVVRGRGAY